MLAGMTVCLQKMPKMRHLESFRNVFLKYCHIYFLLALSAELATLYCTYVVFLNSHNGFSPVAGDAARVMDNCPSAYTMEIQKIVLANRRNKKKVTHFKFL